MKVLFVLDHINVRLSFQIKVLINFGSCKCKVTIEQTVNRGSTVLYVLYLLRCFATLLVDIAMHCFPSS